MKIYQKTEIISSRSSSGLEAEEDVVSDQSCVIKFHKIIQKMNSPICLYISVIKI